MANVKKILFYSVGAFLVGGTAFILLKKNKDKAIDSSLTVTPSSTTTGSTTTGSGANNGTGSLSRLPFAAMAAKLFIAFQGLGTNFTDVKDVLQLLQNQSDYDALVTEYGVREISALGSNPLGYFWPPFKGNLPETLRDELSASEISAINSIFRNKGIQQI